MIPCGGGEDDERRLGTEGRLPTRCERTAGRGCHRGSSGAVARRERQQRTVKSRLVEGVNGFCVARSLLEPSEVFARLGKQSQLDKSVCAAEVEPAGSPLGKRRNVDPVELGQTADVVPVLGANTCELDVGVGGGGVESQRRVDVPRAFEVRSGLAVTAEQREDGGSVVKHSRFPDGVALASQDAERRCRAGDRVGPRVLPASTRRSGRPRPELARSLEARPVPFRSP